MVEVGIGIYSVAVNSNKRPSLRLGEAITPGQRQYQNPQKPNERTYYIFMIFLISGILFHLPAIVYAILRFLRC